VSSRILVAVAVATLGLAPAAAAKGPHAIVDPGPAGLAPGERWVATLTLNELRARAHPRLVLRSATDRFTVRPRRMGANRYQLSAVFPSAGRWSYAVLAAGRRFEFPAAAIGAGERDAMAYVAFPKGSPAERQGAGGPYMDEGAPPAGGDPLPPEVVMPAAADDDGGGLAWWIPAAGLALAGAGTVTVVRRRR
jgi:hypothetical protein